VPQCPTVRVFRVTLVARRCARSLACAAQAVGLSYVVAKRCACFTRRNGTSFQPVLRSACFNSFVRTKCSPCNPAVITDRVQTPKRSMSHRRQLQTLADTPCPPLACLRHFKLCMSPPLRRDCPACRGRAPITAPRCAPQLAAAHRPCLDVPIQMLQPCSPHSRSPFSFRAFISKNRLGRRELEDLGGLVSWMMNLSNSEFDAHGKHDCASAPATRKGSADNISGLAQPVSPLVHCEALGRSCQPVQASLTWPRLAQACTPLRQASMSGTLVAKDLH